MFKFWVAAHCPKTKKAKPVTVGADVTVNESFLGQICTVCTVSSVPAATSLVFMRIFRLFLGQCVQQQKFIVLNMLCQTFSDWQEIKLLFSDWIHPECTFSSLQDIHYTVHIILYSVHTVFMLDPSHLRFNTKLSAGSTNKCKKLRQCGIFTVLLIVV